MINRLTPTPAELAEKRKLEDALEIIRELGEYEADSRGFSEPVLLIPSKIKKALSVIKLALENSSTIEQEGKPR